MSTTTTDPAARRLELSELATKKVFRRLVPFLLLMYVIAFLDRSNVSFAQKEFETDFGISAAAYAFGAGLFFVGYAVFEVPSNILLHRVGARWWLARIMVTWGIVAACFAFVQGPTSFYVLRFLLGITEAGFFPGVILYLTYWIPARHLSRARGYFYMGIALAGILGNPLSGSLLELDGVLGFRGIQWMFVVEGLLAVVVGVWSFFYLTDRPKDAQWLPSEERTALMETVEGEDQAKSDGSGPGHVWAALSSWRVWYFAAIYFCIQIAVYGVTFFLPTQVTAITGQKLGFQASLVTAIPWVFGLLSVAFFPGLADRTRRHRTIGTTLLLVTALGICASGYFRGSPVLAIGGLALAAIGFVAMQPIFWTLPTEYMTGYAAAAGIGLINSLGNLGGFLAPNMRDYFVENVGPNAGLYSLAVGAVLGAILFASTALFRKANDVEAGQIDGVNRVVVPPLMPTLDELVAGRPEGPEVDVAALAERVRASGRMLLVLDDDPTGTQSVADLPVLMDWTPESFGWAFDQQRPAVYVMTNTRSLVAAEAERVNREVASGALAVAAERGIELCFVSRSDSTLRGHFPLETDVLAEEVARGTGRSVDGVLLVPAFGDAGRITVDGVHYAGADGAYVPVGESEFARDATFGYAASDLREWVAEKSHGRIPAASVAAIDLTTLRTAPEEVVATLRSLTDGQPVVVDIVTENDLRLLASATLTAQQQGSVLVVRAGPPLPRALVGQEPHPPLRPSDLTAVRAGGLAEDARGGLVVVGSHVALTTRQLERLVARRDPVRVELDVAEVLGDDPAGYVTGVAERAAAALAEGDVVVSTSRLRVDGAGQDESLAIARRVSTALVEVVQQVLAVRPPRFVVAKGGITSSDVAARGLGIVRAMVRGPMLPGIVSLWEPVGGPARGIPYVVFAGNVGGPESLADVVDLLAAPADSEEIS